MKNVEVSATGQKEILCTEAWATKNSANAVVGPQLSIVFPRACKAYSNEGVPPELP